jgi:two-component system response regulator CssR
MKETDLLKIRSSLGIENPVDLLTRNEIMLLSILLSYPNRFFTMEEIAQAYYLKFNKDVTFEAIKALIKRLRKKHPQLPLENRFGHGYRLVV